jgi:ubiquinone/menaquinone biosynthesis C-methylase UbiE/peptidoglycan/xylan/chitin deacetylase (PgdA/CDA1 family)
VKRARKAVILVYHGFTDKGRHKGIENHQGKHLDIAIFKEQMEFLKKNYNVISLGALISSCKSDDRLPDNPVVITIDDGYESNYKLAYPVLKSLKIPAAIFLTTGFIDGGGALWVDRLEYSIGAADRTSLDIELDGKKRSFLLGSRGMKIKCERTIRQSLKRAQALKRDKTIEDIEDKLGMKLADDNVPDIYRPMRWEEAAEMAESGLITIGSHTHNHIALTVCDKDTALEEVSVSKTLIEKNIACECGAFCYPNGGVGDFSGDTKNTLKGAGYSCALLNIPGFNGRGSDVFELKRMGMGADPTMAEFVMTLRGISKIPAMIRDRILIATRSKDGPQGADVLEKFDKDVDKYSDQYKGSSAVAHSFTARRRKVYELIDGVDAKRVLDVGCGPGVMAGYFASRDADLYGIDISNRMISRCAERFKSSERLHFSVGDVERLEFPDGFFDIVICMGVLEYLDGDAAALGEISRVLKPGGTMIVTLPNKSNPYRLWYNLVCNKRVVGLVKSLAGKEGATIRHNEYKEEAAESLLARYGMTISDIVYYNFNIFPFPLDKFFGPAAAAVAARLEHMGRGRLRKLGTGFIVKAIRR